MTDQRILIGMTGASGAIYAERLTEELLKRVPRVYLVATEAGRQVMRHELTRNPTNLETERFSLLRAFEGDLSETEKKVIRVLNNDDLFAAVASGSSAPTSMVVVPCSMGTLARLHAGTSSNLLDRAADVVLKEGKTLVICPRETPLNRIHLRNMLGLVDAGARIVPPMPAFYQNPKTLDDAIDFVVGRLLESLGFEHDLYPPWNSRMR